MGPGVEVDRSDERIDEDIVGNLPVPQRRGDNDMTRTGLRVGGGKRIVQNAHARERARIKLDRRTAQVVIEQIVANQRVAGARNTAAVKIDSVIMILIVVGER